MAHAYIDAVATTGVNAIKFQTHIADAESSPFEPFRVPFSYQDATRQDYWRRMEFSPEHWAGLKTHCEAAGLEFMSTPTCVAAVELLERIGMRRYKVGSGDIGNRLLLSRVAATGKQVLLSTGLATYEEIDRAVELLTGAVSSLVVMQCTSEYPVPPDRAGLNLIAELRSRYAVPIGYSDHSGTIGLPIAAVALGAEYVESHVVFDRRMFGPDTAASITIDEMKAMTAAIRAIECSLRSGFERSIQGRTSEMKTMFGKTLSVRRDLKAGDTIGAADLESTKPGGMGIPAADFESVLGKVLRTDLSRGDFLKEEHLSPA